MAFRESRDSGGRCSDLGIIPGRFICCLPFLLFPPSKECWVNGVSGSRVSTRKRKNRRMGRMSNYLVPENVRYHMKQKRFMVFIGLPLPWGPLGSKGSPPMGSHPIRFATHFPIGLTRITWNARFFAYLGHILAACGLLLLL